jgi:hypothetical protein
MAMISLKLLRFLKPAGLTEERENNTGHALMKLILPRNLITVL